MKFPEDTFLEKPKGEAGCQIDFTPSPQQFKVNIYVRNFNGFVLYKQKSKVIVSYIIEIKNLYMYIWDVITHRYNRRHFLPDLKR